MQLRFIGLLMISSLAVFAKEEPTARIEESAKVFTEIMGTPDKSIPQELIQRAKCLVIIPGMKKAGFIVGAQYGKGVMVCRQAAGRTGWSGPSTVRIEGGSIGAQIGGGETDVVLVVLNQRGAEKLMKSEFTLGADAGVMAGPVGREGSAQTDALMTAEILSYSRSRGLFAGVTLNGSTLRSDDKDNAAIYGSAVTHQDILNGKVKAPASANVLYSSLRKYPESSNPERMEKKTTTGERSRKTEKTK
ncbi:MAG TPA: lipid-binding SYLF domain-containing protein [Bryobacteraceae bacterium]|nr:lipid-binding SYLF domain-containing protein [Bryobacteraceae bacterium]